MPRGPLLFRQPAVRKERDACMPMPRIQDHGGCPLWPRVASIRWLLSGHPSASVRAPLACKIASQAGGLPSFDKPPPRLARALAPSACLPVSQSRKVGRALRPTHAPAFRLLQSDADCRAHDRAAAALRRYSPASSPCTRHTVRLTCNSRRRTRVAPFSRTASLVVPARGSDRWLALLVAAISQSRRRCPHCQVLAPARARTEWWSLIPQSQRSLCSRAAAWPHSSR